MIVFEPFSSCQDGKSHAQPHHWLLLLDLSSGTVHACLCLLRQPELYSQEWLGFAEGLFVGMLHACRVMPEAVRTAQLLQGHSFCCYPQISLPSLAHTQWVNITRLLQQHAGNPLTHPGPSAQS